MGVTIDNKTIKRMPPPASFSISKCCYKLFIRSPLHPFVGRSYHALDNDTEKAVMDAIRGLKGNKTVIIVAHRLSTIEHCDIVYKVEKGKVKLVSET